MEVRVGAGSPLRRTTREAARDRHLAVGRDDDGLDPVERLLARIDAVSVPFQAAEDKYRAAYKAWSDAFFEEKLRREDHRRTMDKLIGLVRAAFPGDAGRRRVIVPDVSSNRRKTSEPDAPDEPELDGDEPEPIV